MPTCRPLEQHGVLAIDKKQTRAIGEGEESLVAARKGEAAEWPEEEEEYEGEEGGDQDELGAHAEEQDRHDDDVNVRQGAV